jgi:isoleucyl-tRNA synthetase
VDLSSFYLDVLKDRMYTFAPTSHERRSAQTVLWRIAETLVRLVAPILSFTADEVWEYLPKVEAREASVHLALFPKPEEIFSEDPAKLLEEWKQLFAVRDLALVELEGERKAQRIGKGLEADLLITTTGEPLASLQHLSAADLKEFFNVSNVRVVEADLATWARGKATGFKHSDLALFCETKPLPASGHKCARCWNFMPEVSNYGAWENVCTRCQDALKEMKIAPPDATEAVQ